jgi:hypothetical protein
MRRKSFSTDVLKWRLYSSTAGEPALHLVLVHDRLVASLRDCREVVQIFEEFSVLRYRQHHGSPLALFVCLVAPAA